MLIQADFKLKLNLGFKGYVIEKLNLGFMGYVIEKLNLGFMGYVIEKLNSGFKVENLLFCLVVQ